MSIIVENIDCLRAVCKENDIIVRLNCWVFFEIKKLLMRFNKQYLLYTLTVISFFFQKNLAYPTDGFLRIDCILWNFFLKRI